MRRTDKILTNGNRFDRMELAGAFGDLGTLVPFVLIYINLLKFEPSGILLGFGMWCILSGWLYKTPVPVQPMKAIGTFASTHTTQVTQGMVAGAGLFTGIFWIIMAATGFVKYLTILVKRPVINGIVLGLGFLFMTEGLKMMVKAPAVALAGLFLIILFRKNKKLPGIFVVLVFGIILSVLYKPGIISELLEIRPSFSLPRFNVHPFTLRELLTGAAWLALPQIPLTLGNGVLALAAENNRLFPGRPVSSRKISLSTGLMNIWSTFTGGVPMCHGAGGMAGHVRFGATTGGATVILGVILLTMGLFFSKSINLLLGLFPAPILGLIMLLAGIELGISSYYESNRNDYRITVITAGITLWNTGAALLAGVLLTKFLKEDLRELEGKNPKYRETC